MTTAYEIYTANGIEVSDSLPIAPTEGWYRIRQHQCRNDERLPCDPWVTVAEYGEIPEDAL